MAQPDNNGARPNSQLGFETALFKAADKLRGNMEPSDYKHVALGLIFLKYISDAFEARHADPLAEDPQATEDRDEYLADNIFWVPKDARWSHLKANAKRPEIGQLIMGTLVDRTRRELTDADIQKIADTYHARWGAVGAGPVTAWNRGNHRGLPLRLAGRPNSGAAPGARLHE